MLRTACLDAKRTTCVSLSCLKALRSSRVSTERYAEEGGAGLRTACVADLIREARQGSVY